jgi:hypothetical protein
MTWSALDCNCEGEACVDESEIRCTSSTSNSVLKANATWEMPSVTSTTNLEPSNLTLSFELKNPGGEVYLVLIHPTSYATIEEAVVDEREIGSDFGITTWGSFYTGDDGIEAEVNYVSTEVWDKPAPGNTDVAADVEDVEEYLTLVHLSGKPTTASFTLYTSPDPTKSGAPHMMTSAWSFVLAIVSASLMR